jgi:UDP-N-acetylmuramoyl-tripeptide--D-alanyl-D-alanine ligase
MGANRIGDVAELVKLARPTVGLITNAGAEHLEGFGDLDGVARGEGEMVECLEPKATAIINADDAYAGYWRGAATHAPRRHLRRAQRLGRSGPAFGLHAKNSAAGDRSAANSPRASPWSARSGEREILLKAGGAHNIANALGAAAAAAAGRRPWRTS